MAHRPGDRVFAKIKGFSNWPARINPLPPDVQIPKGKLPVFFYGTYQVSFVPPKNIVPYEKFKDKWGKPKSSPQFTTAMQEIESNPGIFMLGEFYKFRPGHTLPSTKNKEQEPVNDRPPSSPDDLSSLSDTTNAPMPTAPPSRSVPSKKDVNRTDFKSQHIQESVKSAPEIREHLSETSSDFSSAISKQDSADIIDDDVVSDDDAVTKQSQNQEASTQPSDVEDESLSASVTHSTDHTEPLGGYELDSESREAYRLARKQKKAEKRAMKAAKREAKRLVKEQERAEKRARREAKRELKRLHRLKKQQIASSDYQEEEFSQDVMVMPSPSAMDWTMQAGIDSVAGGDLSPFDACIEAELQQGNLTPLSDRPTSPLRLEDYPAIECYEDLTMVQSVEELTDSVHESLPVPSPPTKIDQLPFSPSPTESEQQKSSPMRTAKRTLEETSPVHDVGKCDELDVPPKKRPKSDSWSSTLKSNSRSAKMKSRGSPDLDKSDDQSTVKSRASHSRTKKLQSSRRRLLSDTSEDDHVEKPNRIRSPVHEDVPKPSPTVPNDPSEQTEDKPKESDPTPSEQVEPKPVKSESSVEHHKKQYSHKNHKNQSSKGRNQRPSTHPNANLHEPNKHEPTKNADLCTPKKSHTPESELHGASSVVSQLCQLCRELKGSLVRGHENFALAVGYLTQLTTISIRLPELAQAWDLMDCIKKCRRYKLSAEVREAAERALKRFQSIRCTATKEELAQTQALVAVHQRQASSKEAANRSKQPVQLVPPSNHVDLTTTTDIPVVGTINSCPPTTINSVASAPPATTAAVVSSVDKPDSPLNRNSSGLSSDEGLKSISADLDAKVDDVLSRIRAAEERMAAAALATTSSSTTNRPGFMHISDKAYGNGHTIRASAVAAAAAHIRDEEDEESVMSRVEQVAAYQAAAASKVSTLPAAVKVEIPPPPPPPPPPIPLQSSKSSSPLRPPSPLPVDLDLDSRIERLITRPAPVVDTVPPPPPPTPPPAPQRTHTDNGHTPHLPAALLARRRTIANKLAAAKALGSAASHDVVDSTASTAAEPKGDDEIYDLLGV